MLAINPPADSTAVMLSDARSEDERLIATRDTATGDGSIYGGT
jgi:hypothetical protein